MSRLKNALKRIFSIGMNIDATCKGWSDYRNIKVSGIYMIKNIINSKIYIGQSIDLYNRNYGHTTALKNNREHNPHLQNSWNKYGESNFVYKPILFCEKEELERYEKELIKIYRTQDRRYGYNVTPGGKTLYGKDHPMYGRKQTAKAIDSMKKRMTGKNNPWYGKVPLKAINESARIRSIPVIQLDKKGNFIKRFNSMVEGAKAVKVGRCLIFKVCNKIKNNYGSQYKTAGGYIWQYEKDYNAGIPVGG